jgi:hypothetical protein
MRAHIEQFDGVIRGTRRQNRAVRVKSHGTNRTV